MIEGCAAGLEQIFAWPKAQGEANGKCRIDTMLEGGIDVTVQRPRQTQ
jgi:hypothetical protein